MNLEPVDAQNSKIRVERDPDTNVYYRNSVPIEFTNSGRKYVNHTYPDGGSYKQYLCSIEKCFTSSQVRGFCRKHG